MNEKFYILIKISLKFVPKVPIDNKSAMVQVMACRRTGDKPLPEPSLTNADPVHRSIYAALGWPSITPYVIRPIGQYWMRKWLVIYKAPIHYLNQCGLFASWTIGSTVRWHYNQSTIFLSKKEYLKKKSANICSELKMLKQHVLQCDDHITELNVHIWVEYPYCNINHGRKNICNNI